MDTQTVEFVITPNADRLLSNFSGELSEFILNLARQFAEKRGEGAETTVTTDDIKQAFQAICASIEQGIKSGQLGGEISEHVRGIREFCDAIECEAKKVGDPAYR